jgi:hypothetical protein
LAAVCRGGTWGSIFDEGAVDVGECSRFHALASFGAATRNDGTVDRVRGLVKPFVFAFAAVLC